MSKEELDSFEKEVLGESKFETSMGEVDINLLSSDGLNPNIMSPEQRIALRESIRKYGQLKLVVTNENGVIADGEHTWNEMKVLGYEKIKVLKINVPEIDRRMLRQVLNKLHGEHDVMLDSKEFGFLDKSGSLGDLAKLLAQDKADLEAIAKLARNETLPEAEIKRLLTDNKCPSCGYEW